MAHLIENMAYVGQTPWHGLGNQLTTKQPIEVWAQQAGMDWNILETPVRYIAGGKDYLGELKGFAERNVLYRSDTFAPLSVVGQRYKVVQPREILEFYRDLTEISGFELETAGVLKGGKKIWALAKTGQTTVLKGNDVTNGYVLLATACDGSMATTAQFTSVRVVCNNTLAIALDGCSGAVKVPHSTTFDAQAVKQQLGISVSTWDNFMYSMRTLSDRKVNSRGAQSYFQRVFMDDNKLAVSKSTNRNIAKVMDLFDGQGRGSDLSSAKGTAFGLLNAVTEYVDHQRTAKNTDYRLDSAWFGQGANIKQKALEEALLLVA
jgi:phage/plasmid-like protein (TIGR03299 family)